MSDTGSGFSPGPMAPAVAAPTSATTSEGTRQCVNASTPVSKKGTFSSAVLASESRTLAAAAVAGVIHWGVDPSWFPGSVARFLHMSVKKYVSYPVDPGLIWAQRHINKREFPFSDACSLPSVDRPREHLETSKYFFPGKNSRIENDSPIQSGSHRFE